MFLNLSHAPDSTIYVVIFCIRLILILGNIVSIFTSPTGAVAQYCDVCLSVQQDISGTMHTIFIKFLRMLPMSVAQSSSGMLMIGSIAYRREGVFFPIDNALQHAHYKRDRQ